MKITLVIMDEIILHHNHTINIPGAPYIGVTWTDDTAKYLNQGDQVHILNEALPMGGCTVIVRHKGTREGEGLILYCYCSSDVYRSLLTIYSETDEQGNSISPHS